MGGREMATHEVAKPRPGGKWWLLAALGCATWSPPAAGEGVVLQRVAEQSALAAAGATVGDRVLAWERGPDLGGTIASMFDWMELEVEGAPRGTVRLEIERDGVRRSLDVARREWGGTVRPVFSPALLVLYERADTATAAAAVAAWRELAAAARSEPATAAWALLRAAKAAGEAGDLPAAEAAIAEALKLVPGTPAEGFLWETIGGVRERGRQLDAAKEAQERALALRRSACGDCLAVAMSEHALGNALWAAGKAEEAQAAYERALAVRERLAPGSLVHARILNNLGVIAYYQGELARPAELYTRALSIYRELAPGGSSHALTLNNLGVVYYARGDLETAEAHYRELLALWKEPPRDRLGLVASVRDNLANLAYERGDLDRAEQLHLEALAIWRDVEPGSQSLAECLDSLGVALVARGDFDRAEAYQEEALGIRRELGNKTFIGSSLTNLGALARGRGDLERAEALYRQAIDEETLPPGSLFLASGLGNLGEVALARRRLAPAQESLERAVALFEELAPGSLASALAYRDLGEIELLRGKPALARERLARALAIEERLAPQSRSIAETLRRMATLERGAGRLAEAGELLARALAALESQVGRLGATQEVEAAYRAGTGAFYRDAIEVELLRGRPEVAFALLERSRARGFLELLAHRDLDLSAGAPAELLRERRRLAGEYDRAQARLAEVSPERQGEQAKAILAELAGLRAGYEAVSRKLREASPQLAALEAPQPLDVAGARSLLEPGMALLSFSVGETSSDLFVLAPGRPLATYPLGIGEAELRRDVDGFRALIAETPAGSPRLATLRAAGARLYARLLGPAQAQVAAAGRLLILPDGPLHLLPWSALVTGPDGRYLIERTSLSTALSATVYGELLRRRPVSPHDQGAPPERAPMELAPTELVAFGDPDVPAGLAAGAPGSRDAALRDVALRGAAARGCGMTPLPAARRELQGVASLYGDGARLYLGAQATEEAVKALPRSTAVVHFAVHGCLDERRPLDSALVLSLHDPTQENRDNGLLQAWEIVEQVRIDADLVVLSACETALGKEAGGEGLLGLTRAFQFAGARTVVASLWKVADEATAELMLRLHRDLRAGKPKDEALASAQRELAAGALGGSRDFSTPFYWAAFQVYGDWR
jgi:CHAT domain-containing protein/Tfp pilus assembly protein PilF